MLIFIQANILFYKEELWKNNSYIVILAFSSYKIQCQYLIRRDFKKVVQNSIILKKIATSKSMNFRN